MKKILIAIDGGPLSEKTAQKGHELASSLKAEVALLYVADNEITTGESGYTLDQLVTMDKNEGKAMLEKLKQQLKDEHIWLFVEAGNPAKTVIRIAEEWDADLIVTGTHGRKGFNHLIMGSIAEHIIRNSRVPVLVISAKVH